MTYIKYCWIKSTTRRVEVPRARHPNTPNNPIMRHMHNRLILLMAIFIIVISDDQLHRPNCVDGKPRINDEKFRCDQLITAAIDRLPGQDPEKGLTGGWKYPEEMLPYYKDGSKFEKDSDKNMSTCTTNADCKYLDLSNRDGYCYFVRNIATNDILENKTFCFALNKYWNYGTYHDYHIDPNAIGLKYCNSHSDCLNTNYTQEGTFNSWFCYEYKGWSDADGNKPTGVCIREKACDDDKTFVSLTVHGDYCTTDDTCQGAGIASVDTANDYTPKCISKGIRQPTKLCCQEKQRSCSSGFNFRPKTACKTDKDCFKFAKKNHHLICDKAEKKCCDVTISNSLRDIPFDDLIEILSDETELDSFHDGFDLDLAERFKQEFTLRFDDVAIKYILSGLNAIRESVSNGTFQTLANLEVEAAANMKPLEWNTSFEVHAKAVAIKSCSQKLENYNVEVVYGSPQEIGYRAVENWKYKLVNNFSFTRIRTRMMATPSKDVVLQMIYDNISEVGCSYTMCEPFNRGTPTVVCYFGTTSTQKYVYQIAK